MADTGNLTVLMRAWQAGDGQARERLNAAVYQELRVMARRRLAGERGGHTLQPTALVHEAWLRLAGAQAPAAQVRGHLMALAARVMREILIDHARSRGRGKRDGGQRLSLTQVDLPAESPGVDLLDLDAALARLEDVDPERARLVELRYFGGLSIEETARALGQSPATVKRHWQSTRLWLYESMVAGQDARPGSGQGGADAAADQAPHAFGQVGLDRCRWRGLRQACPQHQRERGTGSQRGRPRGRQAGRAGVGEFHHGLHSRAAARRQGGGNAGASPRCSAPGGPQVASRMPSMPANPTGSPR